MSLAKSLVYSYLQYWSRNAFLISARLTLRLRYDNSPPDASLSLSRVGYYRQSWSPQPAE